MPYFVKSKTHKTNIASFTLLLLSSIFISSIVVANTASATTGWDPGNIISDAVLSNENSMSVTQIQSFLNSKVPTCDTNGTQSISYYYNSSTKYVNFYTQKSGSSLVTTTRAIYGQRWNAYHGRTDGDTPFVCLKNYKENSLSSAQIIYNAAHQYHINPQALIVLLEKEQSLVTDTWPQGIQYQYATGYCVPDFTEPNCASNRYGFTNQVNRAASDWHLALTPGSSFISGYIPNAINDIPYNPSTSCGSSKVYIQNRATWAFYTYTPYQPNQAALDAPMGTEVPCGAYGNLNFFRYFTAWFGSTYAPLVFKTTTSDQAYLLSGNKYYRITSSAMLSAYGFSHSNIGVVTPNILGLYQDGGTLKNTTRIGGGSEIYLVDHGKFLQFPSSQMYNSYGYTVTGKEQDLDPLILNNLSKGPTLTDIAKSNSLSEIYLITGNKKSHISSPEAYKTLGTPIYSSRGITLLSQTYIDNIVLGTPIVTADEFVKDSSDNKTYFWDGTDIQLIDNQTVTDLAIPINYTSATVGQLPVSTRSTINQLVKDTDGKLYIINGKQKLEIQPTDVMNLGFVDTDFAVLPVGLMNRLNLPTTQFSGAFRINNSAEVYVIKSGKRYHVTSASALGDAGFTFSQVVNLNTRTAALFPDSGKKILSQGQLFRIETTAAIYMVNSSSSSLHALSLQAINAYGLSIKNVQSYTAQQASDYPSAGNLQYFAKDTLGNVWQIDNLGQKRPVSIELSGTTVFKLDVATIPTISDIIIARLLTQPAMTNLIRVSGQPQIYKIENGTKRWVSSRTILDSLGLLSSDVRTVSNGFKDSITTGLSLK